MGFALLTKLDVALAAVTQIGFDTTPIIYFVEANPNYDALVTDVFRRVDKGLVQGITSAISVCEVLIVPMRNADVALQAAYKDLLLNSAHFETVPVTADVAELGASLRATYKLRTPDALQIACAIDSGCDVFLTNDMALKRVSEIRVLVLDEIEL